MMQHKVIKYSILKVLGKSNGCVNAKEGTTFPKGERSRKSEDEAKASKLVSVTSDSDFSLSDRCMICIRIS